MTRVLLIDDDALRHGATAEGAQAPDVTVTVEPMQWCLCIRDTGGVGLGLCAKLVLPKGQA